MKRKDFGKSLLATVMIGTVTFDTAGMKEMKFNVTGKNAGSSGYETSLDYVKLQPLPRQTLTVPSIN
jgi:hypothetical protein